MAQYITIFFQETQDGTLKGKTVELLLYLFVWQSARWATAGNDPVLPLTQVHLNSLFVPIQVGAKVLFDCCQSVPCRPTDVQQLGADWIVGAGHKMCGPTGSAFLWGKYVHIIWQLPLCLHVACCDTCCTPELYPTGCALWMLVGDV